MKKLLYSAVLAVSGTVAGNAEATNSRIVTVIDNRPNVVTTRTVVLESDICDVQRVEVVNVNRSRNVRVVNVNRGRGRDVRVVNVNRGRSRDVTRVNVRTRGR